MTVKQLYNDFKYLAEIALTIEPYASDFTTYKSEVAKNHASVRVYRGSTGFRSVEFTGYGNKIEFDFHDTPQIQIRHGSLEHNSLKQLHDNCKKLIHENVELRKSLDEAEQEKTKEFRRKQLKAELAELN